MRDEGEKNLPKPTLSVLDAVAVIVGIVVGAGSLRLLLSLLPMWDDTTSSDETLVSIATTKAEASYLLANCYSR